MQPLPIVTGNAAQSRVVQAIKRTGQLAMPPGPKLPDAEIAMIERWISAGAGWPKTVTSANTPAQTWWSFKKPVRPPTPALKDAWVRTIYKMIASGEYPNLYTDISYTVFTPRVAGLYVDLVDYLKVLLNDSRVRKRVLFGSDYYMVERESISEKEASLLLRSRLGEELYKQIAYTNPREFLGIEPPAAPAAKTTGSCSIVIT